MTEQEWREDVPDWQDSSRRVVVQLGGVQLEGVLWCADVGFTGEDEFPIWECIADDGTKLDFVGADRWRFV